MVKSRPCYGLVDWCGSAACAQQVWNKEAILKINHLLILAVCAGFLSGCNLPISVPCGAGYLISAIDSANATPNLTTQINLSTGCVYELTQVNNSDFGNSGLPSITSPIKIHGNGAVIQRKTDVEEKFRLFYVSHNGSLDISDVTLTGGIGNNYDDPDDVATNSGGAILNRGVLGVENAVIRENTAREGGGIFNAGSMTLKNVSVDSNHDYFGLPGGAGLYNMGTGSAENSTFSANGFPELKDGIFNVGTLTLTNCTVSHNGFSGIDNEGDLYLNHVTIAFNRGVAVGSCGHMYITNSIIAQPPGTGGCGCNTVHPLHPNLDTTGSCGGTLVDIGALHLGPLANNGGYTQTHALLPGSAAIDIVVRECLPTDQRGISRSYGPQCDAGAYEYSGEVMPQAGGQETPSPTLTFQPCVFTARVNLNCRSSPGVSVYPVVDVLAAGVSAVVIGQSADGQFLYVAGPNYGAICALPLDERYGEATGDCGLLPVFTPVPTPMQPAQEPGESPVTIDCANLGQEDCLAHPQQCQWVLPSPTTGKGICQPINLSP